MISSKLRFAPGIALVAAISCAWVSLTLPVASQEPEQQAPATNDQAAPEQSTPDQATPDAAAPAENSGGAAQPSDSGDTASPPAEPSQEAAPAAPQEDTATPPAENGGADVAPAPSEKSSTEAAPAASEGAAAVNASQVQVGTAVFGSDGAKIGEVNGVKSDDAGKVQEILVTDGMPAGINAKVFEIPADKITSVSDGVKLSISSEEAKKLPIIDNSNG